MRTASLALPSLLAACAAAHAPADEPGVTIVLLQHQSASDVAEILGEVLRPACTGCLRRPLPHDAPSPLPVERPVELRVCADPARNALLVRGTTEQVNEALDLARRLDVPAVTIPGAR